MMSTSKIYAIFTPLVFLGLAGCGGGLSLGTSTILTAANPSPTPALESTSLSMSDANLNLSVNNTTLSPTLTGNPRQLTITNTGSTSAVNVSIHSSGFPAGTFITGTTCVSTLTAGSSCTITITPGSVATSACNTGIVPNAGAVTVTSDNAQGVVSNVQVLTYGCIHQGGFLFSIDDTTQVTGSIGGKVVSLVDQAEPYIQSGAQASSTVWASNGAGSATGDVSNDLIPGIDGTSTSGSGSPTYAAFSTYFQSVYTNSVAPLSTAFEACNGPTDGKCNSQNILSFYNVWTTNYSTACDPNSGGAGFCTATSTPTALSLSAAGTCTQIIAAHSDWYLPSICELDSVDSVVTCPAGSDSILANLSFLVGDPTVATPSTSCSPPSGTNCLAGQYWSSTENSSSGAYKEYFNAGASNQFGGLKDNTLGVRCVRSITQ